MKYIKVGWPEIQDYMHNFNYPKDCYYDPLKDSWFIPDTWESNNLGLSNNTGDLEDTMG